MPKPSSRTSTAARPWTATSAWTAALQTGAFGRHGVMAGVRIEILDNVALSTIIVEDGQDDVFAAFVGDRWGFSVPSAGRSAFRGQGGLVWSGPGQWLAVGDPPGDLDDLPARLAGIAAVTDQGDGRALLKLSGEAARRTLQKGLAIDLDPTVFKSGHAAVTALAHLSVQIWQVDDAPTYVVAAARSVSGSIWDWLTGAAAEFGYDVVRT